MNVPYHSPKTAGTTPVPNALFDVVMPTLSDTQLRVLLVVVRSTLGWQDGSQRKERDWLSHRQLQKRTGRAGAAVSGAIDVLVKRGLLEVQDGAGERRTTTTARRATRGPLFYRLGEGWMMIGYSSPNEESIGTMPIASEKTGAADYDLVRLDSEVSGSHLDSTSQRRLHKTKTTKENETKEEKKETEIRLDLSSLESEVLHVGEAEIAKLRVVSVKSPSQSGANIPTIVENLTVEDSMATKSVDSETDVMLAESGSLEANEVPKLKDSTYDFVRHFQAAYAKARMGQSCPPVEESDFKLLEHYLEVHGTQVLEQWLPEFFASNFGYVRRRHWSLGSYLNTIFVLQARGKTGGTMADRRT